MWCRITGFFPSPPACCPLAQSHANWLTTCQRSYRQLCWWNRNSVLSNNLSSILFTASSGLMTPNVSFLTTSLSLPRLLLHSNHWTSHTPQALNRAKNKPIICTRLHHANSKPTQLPHPPHWKATLCSPKNPEVLPFSHIKDPAPFIKLSSYLPFSVLFCHYTDLSQALIWFSVPQIYSWHSN